MKSITGGHTHKRESQIALTCLWLASALCLIISLFIVENMGEKGYIYLRATAILYLSLTLSVDNCMSRGIRVGMGCLMILLALDATEVSWNNAPLYLTTFLLCLHIILSILSYQGDNLIPVTGVKGTGFVLLGILSSAGCVAVGLTVDLRTGIVVTRSLAFGLCGLPIIALANGIPISERDQLIGSFAGLIPIGGAMYLSGNLQSTQPWLLLGIGLLCGIIGTCLCVMTTKTWRSSLVQMYHYLSSGKTSAFFIVIILTFGNIACVNGNANSVEEQTCFKVDDPIFRILEPWKTEVCIRPIEDNIYKGVEEAIPLIMMGLAKGALAVLVLQTHQTNLGEMNAWAMATVLIVSALVLFGLEGRGRCLFKNTRACAMSRSEGYLSGLGICCICALVCLFRCAYSGYYIPWKMERATRDLSLAMGGSPDGRSKGCCVRMKLHFTTKVMKRKDVGIALAVGALLICLISTSTAKINIVDNTSVIGADMVAYLNASAVSWSDMIVTGVMMSNNVGISRSALLSELLSFINLPDINTTQYESVGLTHALMVRQQELQQYWLTTAWTISGTILAMSFLILDMLPSAPSVAISMLAGLLLTAGRIHFGCIISEMNDRLSEKGYRLEYMIDLNIYIISVISIVIGLAWGASIVLSEHVKKTKANLTTRVSVAPTRVQLTVNYEDKGLQTFEETYAVLEEADLLEYFLKSYLIKKWSAGPVSVEKCTWASLSRCELEEGVYILEKTPEEMMILAQACANNCGHINLLKRVEPVRAPVEKKDDLPAANTN